MANTTLNERLKLYLEAEKAILVGGQSYKIGNRTLTRADIGEIQDAITSLIAAGATDENTSGSAQSRRAKQVILRD